MCDTVFYRKWHMIADQLNIWLYPKLSTIIQIKLNDLWIFKHCICILFALCLASSNIIKKNWTRARNKHSIKWTWKCTFFYFPTKKNKKLIFLLEFVHSFSQWKLKINGKFCAETQTEWRQTRGKKNGTTSVEWKQSLYFVRLQSRLLSSDSIE